MFSQFAAYYGHMWRSQFKNEEFMAFAKKEWHEALKSFSDNVFNQAIEECKKAFAMPPSLAQVFNQCRQIKNQHVFYVVAPHKPASPEIAAFNLKRCKEKLAQ